MSSLRRAVASLHPFLWVLGATILYFAIGIAFDPQYDANPWSFLWALAGSFLALPFRLVAAVPTMVLGDTTAALVVAWMIYTILLLLADRYCTRWARSHA